MNKSNYEIAYSEMLNCVSFLESLCGLNDKTLKFLMQKYPNYKKRTNECKKEFVKIAKAKKSLKELHHKIDNYFESQFIINGKNFKKEKVEISEFSVSDIFKLKDNTNLNSDVKNVNQKCFNFKNFIYNKIKEIKKALNDQYLEFLEQRMVDIVNLLNACFLNFSSEKFNCEDCVATASL